MRRPPSPAPESHIPVLHSVPVWLGQTLTWIHTQVKNLEPPIEPHIVCEEKENLDQFPVPHLHALCDSRLRWRLWQRQVRSHAIREGFVVGWARRCGARLLHSHFGNRGWQDLGAARRAGLPHVVTYYGYDVTDLPTRDARWRERYQALFGQVDRVLCEGPFMAAAVARLGHSKP